MSRMVKTSHIMPRVGSTASGKQHGSSERPSNHPRDGKPAGRRNRNAKNQIDSARDVCLQMERALASDIPDGPPKLSIHPTVHLSGIKLGDCESKKVAPKSYSKKTTLRTIRLTNRLRKESQQAKIGNPVERKAGDKRLKTLTEPLGLETGTGDAKMVSDVDDTLNQKSSAEKALRGIIINAVENGQIPLEEVFNTHLTIGSIRSFFAKFKDCLESQSPDTDIAKLSDSVLQVEFVFARSHFKVKAIEEERLARKTKEREDMKRAIEMYKQKSSKEMDTKKIMKSICNTLKYDTGADFNRSTTVPSSVEQKHGAVKEATVEMKGPERVPTLWKQEFIREVDTIAPNGSQQGREAASKLQLNADTCGRCSPKSSDYGHIIPPTSFSFGASGSTLPGAERGRVYHIIETIPFRQKAESRKSKSCKKKSTGLSEEMQAVGVQDDGDSHKRSQSPEKKRKGSDGVAIPIDNQVINH
ncbi:hypothetical protein VTL71DRAFT_9871 [Oculimacula yallundae]|uniref:Uncharacterized protein n=1 Tax=Oculimacula yallundae TaxID=86028 RepID=A0ABR4BSM7_9HELO